jgi:hypothetical protein
VIIGRSRMLCMIPTSSWKYGWLDMDQLCHVLTVETPRPILPAETQFCAEQTDLIKIIVFPPDYKLDADRCFATRSQPPDIAIRALRNTKRSLVPRSKSFPQPDMKAECANDQDRSGSLKQNGQSREGRGNPPGASGITR